MLTLGIIGGMGPEATELMYKKIINLTDASCDQEHIDIIIYNHASMPDRTAAIKAGRGGEIARRLCSDAQMLCRCGAGALAIPCNTSHSFIDEIQASVNVPVINMIEETVRYIEQKQPDAKKIGILATDGTLERGLYRKALCSRGLEAFEPEGEIQKIVMDIIYGQIKAGKRGNPEDFARIDGFLKENNCDAAILGCTELSVFQTNHKLDSYYTDALTVLARRCIEVCGGKQKKMEI